MMKSTSANSRETRRPLLLISVIVPVFNEEEGVARCLRSLTAQTLRDMEILVVYKPGTDGTLDEIRSVGDARIRVLVQEEESGVGGARNMGMEAAAGRYIGFVEGDDFVDADFYERLYQTAEAYGADIAFAGMVDGSGAVFAYDSERVLPGFIERVNSLRNGAAFDKLFSASLIKERNIRFPEGVRWEDNSFIVRAVAFARKVVTVPHTFYHYCPGQWTESCKRRLERDAATVIRDIADFAQVAHLQQTEKAALRAFVYRSFAHSVWDVPAVYHALKSGFGVPLPWTLRHYRKRAKRLWREAGQTAEKRFRHE